MNQTNSYANFSAVSRLGLTVIVSILPTLGQETPRPCPSPSGSNPLLAGELVTCSVNAITGNEWTFDAQAGEIYSASLLETAGGVSHPVLTVYDPTGAATVTQDSTQRIVALIPTVSRGRYRIVLTEGRTQGSFDPYSYNLSFERITAPTDSAPQIPLNLQFTSSIEPPGDRDLYKLNVEAGDIVRFRFARTSGSGTQEAVLVDAVGGARYITSGYVIPSTGVYTLLLQDASVYSSKGTVIVDCQGTCPGPPTTSSLFPHYADGAGWTSTVMLLNHNDLPIQYKLWTRSSDGLSGDVFDGTLEPNGMTELVSLADANDPLWQGSTVLIAPPGVGGLLVFRSAEVPAKRGQQAASVPLVASGNSAWILPFDNRNGFASGLAVATVNNRATTMTLEATDVNGNIIESRTLTLNPNGHQAFVLTDQLPATANLRGLLAIRADTGTSIGVVGLRFSPEGAFTSLEPATMSTTTSTSGSIGPAPEQYLFVPHLASGGGWSTELFAYSRDRATTEPIHFSSFQSPVSNYAGLIPNWGGPGGAWAVAYEEVGSHSAVETTLGRNLVTLRTTGDEPDTSIGWMSVSRASDFSGLAIFRQTAEGPGRIPQEASVPFFPSNISQFRVPFDQRSGSVGLALANPSPTQSRSITIVYRDFNGEVGGQTSFEMPPLAQFATGIDALIPAAKNGVGSIEVTSANGNIAGIGLLFEGSAFTALPALH